MVLGVNLDDLGDHRPGQRAAPDAGRRVPARRRRLHQGAWCAPPPRHLGLRTWDKPAAACLASRVPYGTAVTVDVLSRVERAEAALRALGFDRRCGCATTATRPASRCRSTDSPTSCARRAEVVEAVRGRGYRYVTLDLEGLRSGNLNQALAD